MGHTPLTRLAGIILLAGTVQARGVRFNQATGRMVVEMPVDERRNLLQFWCDQAAELAGKLGRKSLPLRLLLDHGSPALLDSVNCDERVTFTCERDPKEYRSTGGVIRDLAESLDPKDYLLVLNGRQLLLDNLSDLAADLAASGADVGVVAHRDGVPGGAMLIRCGVTSVISPTGFVDMKEQALPRIAQEHHVEVVMRDQPSGMPIRNLTDYVNALRMHYQKLQNTPVLDDPFAENLQSSFAVVQEGAMVDPSARLIDSVICRGARVEAGAIVVRSVAMSGAMIGRNQRVIDRVALPAQSNSSAGAGA